MKNQDFTNITVLENDKIVKAIFGKDLPKSKKRNPFAYRTSAGFYDLNTVKFNITVIQKTILNGCFLDLWGNFCWAINAPGQPPASDKKCNVLSGVLHSPF